MGKEMIALIADYGQRIGACLPDRRLRRVLVKALTGIVTSCSPVIARMAALVSDATCSHEAEATAKEFYRFFDNERIPRRSLWKGIYSQARELVNAAPPPVVPVVMDGVNWEKPYARTMPGLSTIRKSAVPNRRRSRPPTVRKDGKPQSKRDTELTRGFPALACVALTKTLPALCFAHLFSYVTDFVSINREVLRAIRTTRTVLRGYPIRFIADREFDDDQRMVWMAQGGNQFLVRAYHQRTIEVYDTQTGAWRRSSLQEYADTLSVPAQFHATFSHARKKRDSLVRLGYGRIRLVTANGLECWLIVAHAMIFRKPLWLLTNAPISNLDEAIALWWQYRDRPDIEDLFRLLQERGFDVEDMRLRSLARLERLMAVVWAAAQLLWHLSLTLSEEARHWLRRLGGKPQRDRGTNGLYLLLYGLSALLTQWLVEQLRSRYESMALSQSPP
jgi:hypothetical protein